ncbi:MAG: PadR family transcriptional regulator [Candidatus Promineifilaceae bacterium]
MERKLLLLGMLRMQDMHGYQLNELIDTHLGTSIQLKKPTVYKLLGGMEEDGWISFREEQEGNYPPRRVYALTADGESAFQELLRESIATYKPVSYLSDIGMAYLDALPAKEAVTLLANRREEVKNLLSRIEVDEHHVGGFQLMLSHHCHHLSAEMDWLDEVIDQFEQVRE